MATMGKPEPKLTRKRALDEIAGLIAEEWSSLSDDDRQERIKSLTEGIAELTAKEALDKISEVMAAEIEHLDEAEQQRRIQALEKSVNEILGQRMSGHETL